MITGPVIINLHCMVIMFTFSNGQLGNLVDTEIQLVFLATGAEVCTLVVNEHIMSSLSHFNITPTYLNLIFLHAELSLIFLKLHLMLFRT